METQTQTDIIKSLEKELSKVNSKYQKLMSEDRDSFSSDQYEDWEEKLCKFSDQKKSIEVTIAYIKAENGGE
jgi:hypothetical protein